MPKVSIVVPIYNVDKYLRECLDSLVNQTLKDIEIICVNDGSTDNSLEILKSYAAKDDRIKIVDKKNSGYGHSCNLGLCTSTADYVGIIEPDDFVDINMFENLYKIITENNCDAVKCGWYDYSSKNENVTKDKYTHPRIKSKGILNIKYKKALLNSRVSVWSFLYKKSFLNDNNIRFLETPGASYQDTSFNFKVVTLAENIYFTEKAYVYYRQDNVTCSTKRKDGWEFVYKEYAEVDKFLNEHTKIKEIYWSAKLVNQYKMYYWNLLRIDDKYKKEVFEHFVRDFKRYYENGELTDEAFEFLNKKKIMLLINKPQKAFRKLMFKFAWASIRKFRRRMISIKITPRKVNITIFGKQVVSI